MPAKKTYENRTTKQTEQLDPNAQETKDRVATGEIREVQGGESASGR